MGRGGIVGPLKTKQACTVATGSAVHRGATILQRRPAVMMFSAWSGKPYSVVHTL
jgi:hypothetical protein